MSENTKSGFLFKRRNKFPRSWQKRYFTIVQAGSQYVLQYYFKEEDASNEEVLPVGVCELETVNKFEMKDGIISFEAFQINKERNKEWYLKADSEEELQAWAKKIEEFSD
ncbi:PH domain-containing protein [Chloropicon primus]|uniref:PH domain-containing protein n=1 Tax=Chloropicon primus TaxID=1764295 RepID=A0A5B8MLD2_9CHLO|nr:hypothetical protein A3770_05p39560 [Chloropicon primus]UPR00650.1 PH domain-containing protein [Chloropicon primus]|eukprot:QDZ21438.1 hypothetical protein A3770_05p39560 [Chloropicon primus]